LQCENHAANERDAKHSDRTKAQLLRSRLKQWNLTERGAIVSFL